MCSHRIAHASSRVTGPIVQSPSVTGCGCLLLVAALVALLYVFLFGSTDAGEPIAEAAALAVGLYVASIGGRRSPQAPTRS